MQHLFPGRDQGDTIQCVLCLEQDGQLAGDNGAPQLVELRPLKSRNFFAVKGISTFDAMQGMQLEGWRRDAHGRLVAVLRSSTQVRQVEAGLMVSSSANSTLDMHGHTCSPCWHVFTPR